MAGLISGSLREKLTEDFFQRCARTSATACVPSTLSVFGVARFRFCSSQSAARSSDDIPPDRRNPPFLIVLCRQIAGDVIFAFHLGGLNFTW